MLNNHQADMISVARNLKETRESLARLIGSSPTTAVAPSCYRFDRVNQTVETPERRIQLTPKAFAVLDYLRERPLQLATKDELLAAVWPHVYVGDAVLKNKIHEVRQALADDPRNPLFIETVHRRGYRFIGSLPLVNRSG